MKVQEIAARKHEFEIFVRADPWAPFVVTLHLGGSLLVDDPGWITLGTDTFQYHPGQSFWNEPYRAITRVTLAKPPQRDSEVKWTLIGGAALGLYAKARPTQDPDVLLAGEADRELGADGLRRGLDCFQSPTGLLPRPERR